MDTSCDHFNPQDFQVIGLMESIHPGDREEAEKCKKIVEGLFNRLKPFLPFLCQQTYIYTTHHVQYSRIFNCVDVPGVFYFNDEKLYLTDQGQFIRVKLRDGDGSPIIYREDEKVFEMDYWPHVSFPKLLQGLEALITAGMERDKLHEDKLGELRKIINKMLQALE